MNQSGPDQVRDFIEEIVVVASGETFDRAELRRAGGSLEAAGMNSIGYLVLMELLEQELDILIDPEEDPGYLTSVDAIVAFVLGHAAGPARAPSPSSPSSPVEAN